MFSKTILEKENGMKRIISLCCALCFVIITTSCCLLGVGMNVQAEKEEAKFDVKAAYLMDYDSKVVLYEQNAREHLPVASMVKLMTILLTFEEIDAGRLSLDEMITTSENASGMGGSQVFIDPHVDYKCEDLLKSVIVASANDASVALAERIAGTEEDFVKLMNKRAKDLGMLDTNYVNCTGLPAPMQYSCARDIATLDREVITHKDYFNYSTIWMEDLVHPSGRKTGLVNTNKLIRYFKGCDCGKTGSTSEAGYCLTASAKRGDMRLIGTIIGAKDSKSRFNETSKLLNYGFANFVNKKVLDVNDILGELNVQKSKTKMVNVSSLEDYYAIMKKGGNSVYEIKVEMPENIPAPVRVGQNVGKVMIVKDNEVVAEIPLISRDAAEKLNFSEALSEVIQNWAFWG